MTDDRKRRAAEVAMKRRRGASRAHSEKVKTHMLAQEDLYTTCQKCGCSVRGSLDTLTQHVENCDGH